VKENKKMSKENTDSTPPTKEKEWKLEESSIWWLSLPVFQNPGNVLLFSSIPFCVGCYMGYKKPTDKLDKLAGVKVDGKEMESLAEARRVGIQTAGRALRLGTLGIIGSYGMIGAAIFYASGYQTLEEAMSDTRIWASSQRASFEKWLNMEDRPSNTHPEVLAMKHMTEEQEMNYIYEQYIKEPEENTTNNQQGTEASKD
jgi:hypothetical protein